MDTTPMRYIPSSRDDIRAMLDEIGVDSVDALFESIPEKIRLDGYLDLPEPQSEIELRRWFRARAENNDSIDRYSSFLGAGSYVHYQPACVDHMLLRGEFLTSYTPYQPEVSQGTLQAIYEYQTHQSMLTGLDVANASLYDGSTAFVEAVLMSVRVKRKTRKVVVSAGIHPEYRETLETYIQNLDIELVEVELAEDGGTDVEAIRNAADDETAAVAVQSPNFFGVVEDYDAVAAASGDALKIAVIAEASSLGILQTPGARGFDIACGEGQAWGIAPQFGGPYVGFLVARDEHKRHMPGRLAGETVDVDGRRAWVLTLATREQHIRRGKATSNICTNQALIALAANIYLSLMGKEGLREVALQNLQKAAYMRSRLESIDGVELPLRGPIYNEMLVRTGRSSAEVLSELHEGGILGGIAIDRYYPDRSNEMLVAVTEMNTREEIDSYAEKLTEILR